MTKDALKAIQTILRVKLNTQFIQQVDFVDLELETVEKLSEVKVVAAVEIIAQVVAVCTAAVEMINLHPDQMVSHQHLQLIAIDNELFNEQKH